MVTSDIQALNCAEGGAGTSFEGVLRQVKEVGYFLEQEHLMESSVRGYNVQARNVEKKKT